ncbi:MAG: sigma factor-like helix-turn-helix DNA-binding protein [Armatimonadota bacterium]
MSGKGEMNERKTRNVERDQEILRHREAGKSLQDIGRMYGISRERVRQILLKDQDAQKTDEE